MCSLHKGEYCMISDFTHWLEGIVEDDPVPYEVKNICFVYTQTNNCFSLFMGGTENYPTLNNMFDYFPLEAQYYNFNELYKIKDLHHFTKMCKYLIDECFSSVVLKTQFAQKRIFWGEYGAKPELLFNLY